MKKLLYLSILLFLFSSCGEKMENITPANNPYRSLELTTKSADYAKQGNTFAINLLSQVDAKTKGNFIISPLSMQFLLGMILDGAQGETADEICSVLGYGANEVDAVNQYCLSMLQQLPNLDKQTKLAIANAVVVNDKYSILSNYKSTVGKFYQADVSNLNFSDNKGTTGKINKWCSDKTNGLIKSVIKEVKPNDFAYLLNASYFKSQWKEPFKKEKTAKETFTKENGSTTTVQMMKNNASYNYTVNEYLKAVRIPYGNGAFSMIVILPNKEKSIDDALSYLSNRSWNSFASSMNSCKVDLWLPKFETSFHIDLSRILADMGMPSAFSSTKANFKAMSDKSLFLSLVQQDAVIKVYEEGTEAAVVSTATYGLTANFESNPVFHADRPFLFFITESSSGAILFAGKYAGN